MRRDGDRPPDTPAKVLDAFLSGKQAANEADNAEVAAFMDAHVANANGAALDVIVHKLEEGARQRRPLHPLAQELMAWALEEAAVGTYPAAEADRRLGKAWLAGYVVQGRAPRPDWKAEWASIRRWTVGQVLDKTDAERAARVERVQLATDTPAKTVGETLHPNRLVRVIPFAGLTPEPVRWLWDGRLSMSSLSLLAGRENIGKSTLAAWLAARVTRGELDGEWAGVPKGVLFVAPEDDLLMTLLPRFLVAGGDNARAGLLKVQLTDVDVETEVTLPLDIPAIEAEIERLDVGLVILDPLTSRLGGLDTYVDAQVRQALEPTKALSERTGVHTMGLIHPNKNTEADALNAVMGSRAFVAMARQVAICCASANDPTQRFYGIAKNNVGAHNAKPTRTYRVVGEWLESAKDHYGRIEWGDDSPVDIGVLAQGSTEERNERAETIEWLAYFLTVEGDAYREAVFKEGITKQKFSKASIYAAAKALKVAHVKEGFQGRVRWHLPAPPIGEGEN